MLLHRAVLRIRKGLAPDIVGTALQEACAVVRSVPCARYHCQAREVLLGRLALAQKPDGCRSAHLVHVDV
eukprot:5372605-Prymnesium_polylepis.1